jgi:D-xylose transport system ATP-binding protein
LSNHPLLELKGVSKRFGGVEALTQIDFQARAGEVMALVGDNGAGKSTLIKGIAGIYPFDKGQVYFDGQKVKIHSPRDSANLGIEVVYQDLALADNLDVVSNMYLGRETTNTGRCWIWCGGWLIKDWPLSSSPTICMKSLKWPIELPFCAWAKKWPK